MDKIRDLPSFKKLEQQAIGFRALLKVAKVASPLLSFVGINRQTISEFSQELAGLEAKMTSLRELPDRFNAHFATRGWIAYEFLNVEIAQQAIDLADAGEIDEAEQTLVDHYCFCPEVLPQGDARKHDRHRDRSVILSSDVR